MKFARSFTYNGHCSKDFDLILVSDDENSEYKIGLEREVVSGNVSHNRHEVFGINTKYSDMLPLNLMVIKNPDYFRKQSDLQFSRDDVRKISRWLTSSNIPKLLSFEDYLDESVEPIDFFGIFTNVESFMAGGLYGLKLSFLCSSPWGYTKEKIYKVSSTDVAYININNTSDELGAPVYPHITITPNASEAISITNKTEKKSFSFIGTKGLTTYIDCKRLMVYDDADIISFRDLGWTTDTLDTLYWPRFINGMNEIKIEGNCDVIFKCRYPRKVGEV